MNEFIHSISKNNQRVISSTNSGRLGERDIVKEIVDKFLIMTLFQWMN